MLAPTKKPRTDKIELRFIGPAGKHTKAVEILKNIGFEVTI
ncbi:MAG: hypothetical protein AB1641_31665 [Thermodesulfobacteriota bacterium]